MHVSTLQSRKFESGAALIFAILVSLLLGVLAAYFSLAAQNSLKLATQLGEQYSAQYAAEDNMLKAIYAVSSMNYSETTWPDANQSFSSAFWGKPLKVNEGITVSYQDITSRLNLVPFKSSEWKRVLQFHGVNEVNANSITDRIEDWMDSDNFRRVNGMEKRNYSTNGNEQYPRNRLMQSLGELKFIPGVDDAIFSIILRESSYWGGPGRTPLNGSEAMINAYASENVYDKVVENRLSDEDGGLRYGALENIDSSLVNRIPSGMFLIEISSKHNNARYVLTAEVNLRGSDIVPFYINEWK